MTTDDDGAVRRRVAFLRRIDGVSHVTVGPVVLLVVGPVAARLGVPRGRLTGFLCAFVAYGWLVLQRSRSEDPRGLLVVVAAGNSAFLACVAASLAVHDLTQVGRLVHLGTAANAALVGAEAVRGLRASSR